MLVTIVGLLVSLGYVGLFTQAFAVVAEMAPFPIGAAALALVTGTLAAAGVAAKAASGEAVRAGSPENEFLLARPVALPTLVMARALAEAVTDPLGALFLLPVLVAAAAVWRLGATALAAAAATSVLVQIATSALAYTAQVTLVRVVAPSHRRGVWMGLRLISAFALACLWMLGTWVLRAPAKLIAAVGAANGWLAHSPGALAAAPLVGLARGDTAGALLGLAGLVAAAGAALLTARFVAAAAGLRGWEEAGAVWAERARGPASRHSPSAATKDLLLVVRDGPLLVALVAMPILFVGVQIFGAAGWTWSTGSLTRVACLSYSLALYMATMGPLAHMQAERRAFWILRSVPVPLGRLLGAKARAWSILIAGIAVLAFVPLSFAVNGLSVGAFLSEACLVVGGAVGMSFLAVAVGASAADLSDDQHGAVGPATTYTFLLVGGLYNLVLSGTAPVRAAGIALYLFVLLAYWRAGVERAQSCMDPEMVQARRLRLADGAGLLLIQACGARALGAAAPVLANMGGTVTWSLGLELAVGAVGAAILARARVSGARRGPSFAGGVVAVLGLGLAAARLTTATWPTAAAGTRAAVLVVSGLLIAAEEIVYRGIVQRTIELELRAKSSSRLFAPVVGAAASVALPALASLVAGVTPGVPFLAGQLAAATAWALTGRTTASGLTRFTGLAIAVVADG